jgi:hypothetical protein
MNNVFLIIIISACSLFNLSYAEDGISDAWKDLGAPNNVSYNEKINIKDWVPYINSAEERAKEKRLTSQDLEIFLFLLNPDQNKIHSSFSEVFSASAFIFKGTAYQPQIAEACKKLLANDKSNAWTKTWCGDALSQFGDASAVPYLIPLLENPDPRIKKVVKSALINLGYTVP